MKRFGLTLFAACLSFSSLVSAFDKPLQRPSVPSYNEIGQTMGFNSRPPIKGGNEASGPFLEGGAQVSFDAEFLYWYSNVTNVVAVQTDLVQRANSQNNPNLNVRRPIKSTDINWSWDPGVRLGIGALFDRDGWDLNGSWTYFYNSADRSKGFPLLILRPNPPGTKFVVEPLRMEPQAGRRFIKARYQLVYHQGLLDFGRRFWISETFNLRPSVGVRALVTSLRYFSFSKVNPFNNNFTLDNFGNFKIKQRYWGVGLTTAVDANWYFYKQFCLASQLGLGLLYGQSTQKNTIDEDSIRIGLGQIQRDFRFTYFHSSYQMLPILDLSLGLCWDTYFSQKRYHLSLGALWENHFHFDFNRIDRFLNEVSGGLTEGFSIVAADGNLVTSGITIRSSFEF